MLPAGRHEQPGKGKPPVAKHSSPAAHWPLQVGDVSPQGCEPSMQMQVLRSVVPHSEPGGQVPAHIESGKVRSVHGGGGGGSTASVSSAQSGRNVAEGTAVAPATNSP